MSGAVVTLWPPFLNVFITRFTRTRFHFTSRDINLFFSQSVMSASLRLGLWVRVPRQKWNNKDFPSALDQ